MKLTETCTDTFTSVSKMKAVLLYITDCYQWPAFLQSITVFIIHTNTISSTKYRVVFLQNLTGYRRG